MSDTNQAIQPRKIVRGLNFQIQEVEGFTIYVAKTKALISCAVTACTAEMRLCF